MLAKMDFKLLLLFASLAVFSDAVKRFPLYAQKLKKEDKAFLSVIPPNNAAHSYKDYALMIQVNVADSKNADLGSYQLVLDSTSNFTWIVSQDYTGHYGKMIDENGKIVAKSNVTGAGDSVVAGNGRIEGKNCTSCILKMTDLTTSPGNNLLVADYIDGDVLRKLPRQSAGVIGLKDNSLFGNSLGPEKYISLFVNPWAFNSSSFFIGIPTDYLLYPDKKLNSLPSSKKSTWNIDLQYISNTEGKWSTWCVGGADAIVDTTYSGISGPANDINSINQFIGTDEDGNIDCERVKYLQPISFRLGGYSYNLQPRNYIKKGDGLFDRKCKSVFEVQHTYNGAWRLGLAFMRQYLTIFQENINGPTVAFSPLNIKNIKNALKYNVYPWLQ